MPTTPIFFSEKYFKIGRQFLFTLGELAEEISHNDISFSYPPIRPPKLEILRAGELSAERTRAIRNFRVT